jgi:DNA-directed RNA polymerase subunit M/transcription elongation factor TFIIS
MYYIKITEDDENKLTYYCRNCGYVDESETSTENTCIIDTDFTKNTANYSHIINKYTKYDPTLPKITNLKCANADCETNVKNIPSDIIYIRVDDDNLKYVYLCTVCDNSWKTDS